MDGNEGVRNRRLSLFFPRGLRLNVVFFLTKLDSGSSRGLEIKSQQRGFGVNLKKNISD